MMYARDRRSVYVSPYKKSVRTFVVARAFSNRLNIKRSRSRRTAICNYCRAKSITLENSDVPFFARALYNTLDVYCRGRAAFMAFVVYPAYCRLSFSTSDSVGAQSTTM